MRRSLLFSLAVAAVLAGSQATQASEGFPTGVDLEAVEIIWSTVHETYFDPAFGGVDWEAVGDRYRSQAASAEDSDEFYRLLNSMIFELERSHSAVIPPDSAGMVLPTTFASGAIGLDVRWLSNEAVVARVEAGSPAGEAGIRPGSVIRSFDGVSVEEIVAAALTFLAPPFNERSVEEAANAALSTQVYGLAGTDVTLAYCSAEGQAATARLTRRPRDRVSAAAHGIPPTFLDFESRWLEQEIGYIRFNTFHPDLTPDFARAIESMREARGVILDLRGNPGGELDAMVDMASYLVEQPAVLLTLLMRSNRVEVPVAPAPHAFRGPLVLLTDVRCTSGSEMLSVSLQALGRATVIGERTPGAVTGANMMPLPNGALFMYPFVQTLAADGSDPEGVGVVPDAIVSLAHDQLLEGIDSQLQAAIEHIVSLGVP